MNLFKSKSITKNISFCDLLVTREVIEITKQRTKSKLRKNIRFLVLGNLLTFSNVCIKCNIVFGSTFFKTNIHILPTSILFVLSITHFDMKNIPRGRPFNNFIENIQTYYIFIQVFLVSWTCLTLQIYI